MGTPFLSATWMIDWVDDGVVVLDATAGVAEEAATAVAATDEEDDEELAIGGAG